jgi:DNA-binding SARP family transcriptional activator
VTIKRTQQLLALEPWQERAQALLMRLLALNGQRVVALVQYEPYRQVLADELSLDPMAETVVLYEQIRQGKLSRGAAVLNGR